MSDVDNCCDNAFMNSCFGTLKMVLELTKYADNLTAERERSESLSDYAQDRRHSSLGSLTPAEFEGPSIVRKKGLGVSTKPAARHPAPGDDRGAFRDPRFERVRTPVDCSKSDVLPVANDLFAVALREPDGRIQVDVLTHEADSTIRQQDMHATIVHAARFPSIDAGC